MPGSKLIWLILLLGLAARLGWGLSRPTDEAYLASLPDQIEYIQIAKNLLSRSGMWFYDPTVEQAVHAYRMPGYPLFVAMCGANVTIVRIVQAAIDASLVMAVILLLPLPVLRERVGVRASDSVRTLTPILSRDYTGEGVIAAALVAFNPYLIYFSSTILSEPLFTALLAWGMVLLIRDSRWSFLAGVGLLIASVYVRPGAIALPVILAILAQIIRTQRGGGTFWNIPAGTLTILLLGLALLPWAYRNKQHDHVGAWIWTTTNSGITLYDGMNPLADGSSNQASFRTRPELREMTEVERSDYFEAEAKRYALENPGRAAWLAWRKVLRTWSPVPLSDDYGSNKLYVAAGLMFAVPLFVLTVLGITFARLKSALILFLLAPALYFTLVHAMTVGSLRYRVPSDVPMAVVAASGAAGIWMSRRRRVEVP
jgi:hypothetical protein